MLATSIARKKSKRLPGITNNVGIRPRLLLYCWIISIITRNKKDRPNNTLAS